MSAGGWLSPANHNGEFPAFVPPGLHVQLERADRRVTARGELDCVGVTVLADVMHTLVRLDPGDTTIELARVSFIDAAGIGALVGFANQLNALGATLTLTGARPRLRRVFDICGVAAMLEQAAGPLPRPSA